MFEYRLKWWKIGSETRFRCSSIDRDKGSSVQNRKAFSIQADQNCLILSTWRERWPRNVGRGWSSIQHDMIDTIKRNAGSKETISV